MQIADLQVIGAELAVKWADGSESFIALQSLRRNCPCAACQGETDALGNRSRPTPAPLTPAAFHLREIRPVGGYGLQPVWADGHAAGIYSFDYLKRLG